MTLNGQMKDLGYPAGVEGHLAESLNDCFL